MYNMSTEQRVVTSPDSLTPIVVSMEMCIEELWSTCVFLLDLLLRLEGHESELPSDSLVNEVYASLSVHDVAPDRLSRVFICCVQPVTNILLCMFRSKGGHGLCFF
jgi:hypothetical protein